MTAQMPLPRVDPTCPYLGLVDDPATHFAYPSEAQRCHAGKRPVPVDAVKQARDCLTSQHVTCSWFHPLASTPLHPNGLAVAVAGVTVERIQKGHGVVSGRSRAVPWARRAGSIGIVAIAVFGTVVVGLLLGTGLATQVPDRGSPTVVPGAGGSSGSPSVGPASTAPATPRPTATPTPTATQTVTSAPPSTSPSASSNANVYVVRPGDTLRSIAEQHGVSVDALKAANVIDDPNLILVGQELVIPAP